MIRKTFIVAAAVSFLGAWAVSQLTHSTHSTPRAPQADPPALLARAG